MSIVRAPRPDVGWMVVRNDVARDARLSYRARGVLMAILSRPDNWRTTSEQLAKEGKEGRDAIRAVLKELEAVGYMVRVRKQGEDGLWRTETVIHETVGAAENPSSVPPAETEELPGGTEDGNPVVGFPGAIRKTKTKDQEPLGADAPTKPKTKRPKTLEPPAGWKPNDTHTAIVREHDLNGPRELAHFLDDRKAKGIAYADWDAGFRTWLRNAPKFANTRPKPTADVPQYPEMEYA